MKPIAVPKHTPSSTSPQVWDYVFLGGEEPAGTGIDPATLRTARRPYGTE